MDMKTSNKRPQGAVKEDHLSNLPESVICHILSRLPTKDAVKTSILSRNWEYKWTSIYDIDIYYEFDRKVEIQIIDRHLYSSPRPRPSSLYDEILELNMNFFRFVDKILDFTHDSKLTSFRLSCLAPCAVDRLQAWIPRVLSCNVEILHIEARGHQTNIELPPKLCSCSSLRELKLSSGCTLKVYAQTCFPTLKILNIGESSYPIQSKNKNFEIVNEQSLDTDHMLIIFPVLELLELHHCTWLKAESVEIRAPELIKFKATYPEYVIKESCQITICAPKLSTFEYQNRLPDNFIVNAMDVTHAILKPHPEARFILPAHKILKWFPRLKYLKLSADELRDIMLMLYRQDSCLRPFNQLQELEICATILYQQELLVWIEPRVFPSLQLLTLDLRYRLCNSSYKKGVFSPCILSQLKEVKFINCNGGEWGIDIIKFLLQNTKGLKRVSVRFQAANKRPVYVKRLTKSEITSLLPTFLPENSTTVLIVES